MTDIAWTNIGAIVVALIAAASAVTVAVINGRRRRGDQEEIVGRLDWLAAQDTWLGQQVSWLNSQIPPGGLSQWIEVTRHNTQVLTELTNAVKSLRETDAEHDRRIRAIEAAHRTDTA